LTTKSTEKKISQKKKITENVILIQDNKLRKFHFFWLK